MQAQSIVEASERALKFCPTARETAFGCPRDFLENRFVYLVISPRARGLSVGINMNPDKECNFDCTYCEVNRAEPGRETILDPDVMATELRRTLQMVLSGELRHRQPYESLPPALLQLRHVSLSGDGEPTLSSNFAEAVQAVVHLRALGTFPFFKMVLITNATNLDRPPVQHGLGYFAKSDEVWAKLDAGTNDYMQKINRSSEPIDLVLRNILALGRKRPVIIQSLFPMVDGEEPSPHEIDQYVCRLNELKTGGAEISLVQIYSATRPTPHSECGHLPLKQLSQIAHQVRSQTGLRVEVF